MENIDIYDRRRSDLRVVVNRALPHSSRHVVDPSIDRDPEGLTQDRPPHLPLTSEDEHQARNQLAQICGDEFAEGDPSV